MKKDSLKRILSGLLAVVLVLGNVPVTAFAADETGLCPHHEAHADCGYVEGVTACGYQCVECAAENEPETTTEPEVTSEPAATEETKPVCTGLVDCAAESHKEGCEKKAADDKAAADKAAADAVNALIAALPSLESIQAKLLEKQGADYNQVQAAYGAYCALTPDQQTLLPPAEEVFKPYFDYFNSQTQEAATVASGQCGANVFWTLDANGVLTISGSGAISSYDSPYGSGTKAPWFNVKSKIKEVQINSGVAAVGANAFKPMPNGRAIPPIIPMCTITGCFWVREPSSRPTPRQLSFGTVANTWW